MNEDILLILEASEKFAKAKKNAELWKMLRTEMNQFACDGILHGYAFSKKEIKIHGLTRALIWRTDYKQHEYFEVFDIETILDNELTASEAIIGDNHMVWHDEENWINASDSQLQQSNTERDIGLHVGVTLSLGRFDNIYSGMGLSCSSLNEGEFDKMFDHYKNAIKGIAETYNSFLINQKNNPHLTISERERTCLSYLANGVKPDQIADKLAISYKTVDKHIVSAKARLYAATKDQAVARAIALGIIKI